MRRALLCILLAVVSTTNAHAGKQHCTLRAHLEANANDTETFATKLRSTVTGKDVVIEKIPTISERDVIAFAPYPADDGTYGVLFKLDDHGRLALDTLSVEKRGTFLYVFVNGRPAAELQIDRRISDGELYIASGITLADLALMKKDWRMIGQRKKK